ncbi:hypothetical protein [Vibrio phage JSF12]|uniref:Uncharacterized protein n=3 Tax=Jesfedecavirus TaxID=2560156 RepID=A0A2D0YLY1_9CAUD|nr:hypothetical protein AVV29_gp071 [Vibrio phage phi 3]YP_009618503.1 hypothetical protein FDI98_gp056 [Vibrio phage JSF10]YP_009794788.1 hypothetical protein HOS35_gp105 [Vibrio phage JSF12]AJF40907.1 hypothetical protein SBVP3_00140 [Vibrio phage phi 3]ASV43476.1 hypothetical protein [Vibrio phage JSF10]ASV43623.1 hypothetical protein [Vibrio phage JSF12]
MTNINFNKVYNDFGQNLPASHTDFFSNPKNELTRKDLERRYKTLNNALNYSRFRAEYEEFLTKLAKPVGAKTKTEVKQDEVK